MYPLDTLITILIVSHKKSACIYIDINREHSLQIYFEGCSLFNCFLLFFPVCVELEMFLYGCKVTILLTERATKLYERDKFILPMKHPR